MLSLIISDEAEEDLLGLFVHIGTTNSWDVAAKYREKLSETFALLAGNPGIGTGRHEIEGLRSFPCQSHTIFFYFNEDVLVVSRVLHGAMDYPEQFGHGTENR